MPKTAYEILGVRKDASAQEIDEAYYALRNQYREEMYQEGAAGKNAARRLNEVEQAYRDICAELAARPQTSAAPNAEDTSFYAGETQRETGTQSATGQAHSPAFREVEAQIRAKDFKAAQDALDDIGTRDAEWHYFQAVIYYNKGWISEAKNQMEMACNMDPTNAHYATVLGKLNNSIDNQQQSAGYNQQTQGPRTGAGYRRSYGEQDARYAEDSVCRICQTMICLNCLCDCCCRG